MNVMIIGGINKMKKGYQEILSKYEEQFPEEMSIFRIKEFLPRVTEQHLLELNLAGFIETDEGQTNKKGDSRYRISKEGFSHLVGLRTYHMAKATKKLTSWIIGLTIVMIVLGIIQIWKIF